MASATLSPAFTAIIVRVSEAQVVGIGTTATANGVRVANGVVGAVALTRAFGWDQCGIATTEGYRPSYSSFEQALIMGACLCTLRTGR
jgi:hypothetical protein